MFQSSAQRLVFILTVLGLVHFALSFRVPDNILSTYFTTLNETGAVESAKHKTVGNNIFFGGVFRNSISISPNIILKHPKYKNDECNLFLVKMDLTTNSILWYKSEILEACGTTLNVIETSIEHNGDCEYVAISLLTSWPCCDFLVTGGPGLMVYNATNGERMFAQQMVVYYGNILSLAFDSSSLFVTGYVGDSNSFGVEVFRDEDSAGKVYNTFILKYGLKFWSRQWVVQSIDRTFATEDMGKNPRLVTGIYPVSVSGMDLLVFTGFFSLGESTTWRDSGNNLVNIEKNGLNGNYVMLLYQNGTILSYLSTRVSTYIVRRKASVVMCGSNSVLECVELSLPKLEPKYVMLSNQLSSCQSTIYSVTGTDSLVFIATRFDSCRNNEIIVQSLDQNLRDAEWILRVNGTNVKSVFISATNSSVAVSYVYSGIFIDLTGNAYSSPRSNLLIQSYSSKNYKSCFGIAYNDTSVCSGHGVCQSSDYCVCNYGYGNTNCSQFTCFGILQSGCNHGTCIGVDKCLCDTSYFGPHCNITTCFNILSTNQSFVCSGWGKCEDYNTCKCKTGYFGNDCSSFMCYEVLSKSNQVCSGRGKCVSTDRCVCQENYFGDNCEHTSCFGIDSNNFTVCHRSGFCVGYDTCSCLTGSVGPDCTIPTCYSISTLSTDQLVCGGNGDCVSKDNCVCKQFNNSLPMYVGKQCETPICFGNIGVESCSGNGDCIGPNNCSCHDGFSGKLCNMDENLLYKILVPVGVVVSCLVFFLLVSVALYIYKNRYWNKRKKTEMEMEKKLLDIELELEDERGKQLSYLIPIEELEIVEKIGSGGFGQVYKARWKQVNVAVKSVDCNEDEEKLQEEDTFEREVLLLNSLKHPNVIQFFGVCITDRRKLMVMEYLGGGSLDKLISELRLKRKIIKLIDKIRILFGVSNGLSYLHNLKPKMIIHRDLKSANILLDENMQPKVCDFGLSKLIGNTNSTNMTTNLGSILYMAPELIGDSNISISNKLDVYSFGIVMYELLFEDYPFLNQNSEKINRFSKSEITDVNSFSIPLKVSKGFRPKIPFSTVEERSVWIKEFMKDDKKSLGIDILVSVVDQYIDLMKDCWDQNPDDRPSFDEVADRLANILSKNKL